MKLLLPRQADRLPSAYDVVPSDLFPPLQLWLTLADRRIVSFVVRALDHDPEESIAFENVDSVLRCFQLLIQVFRRNVFFFFRS